MADPIFAQPERRSFLIPGLIAVAFLALAVAITEHFLPNTRPDVKIIRTSTYAAHTTFKSNSIVVGKDPFQDDLYLVATVHVDNKLRSAIDLKDFTATLTPSGAEPLTASATQKADLANLTATFPALKPLIHTPLLRETNIPAGQTAEGDLVFHFPADQPTYDSRTGLTVTIQTYRQPPISIPIASPGPITQNPTASAP